MSIEQVLSFIIINRTYHQSALTPVLNKEMTSGYFHKPNPSAHLRHPVSSSHKCVKICVDNEVTVVRSVINGVIMNHRRMATLIRLRQLFTE